MDDGRWKVNELEKLKSESEGKCVETFRGFLKRVEVCARWRQVFHMYKVEELTVYDQP